jgi:hypothetical protein
MQLEPLQILSQPGERSCRILLRSQAGGGDEGEINPISLLSDALLKQSNISGSRNAASKQTLEAKPTVVSPRGANLKYAFLLITENNYNKFCRGVISSTLHDQACAKSTDNCSTVSHLKKHDKVKVNYVYITFASSNDTNANRKFFNPSEYCEQVVESEIDTVEKLILSYNQKLANLEQNEVVATETFLDFVSDLLITKVNNATEDGGSEKFMEDEASMVLVDAEGLDHLELVEMLTAKEEEEMSFKIENSENSQSFNLGKKENQETKLTVLTSKPDDKAFSTDSDSFSVGSKLNKKEKSILVPQSGKFTTSQEFMDRYQNSNDGGSEMLKSLCERLILLENYTRTSIRPKVLSNNKKIKEVEEGFNILFNPTHPTQRLDSMQLQLDSFEEDAQELSHRVEAIEDSDDIEAKVSTCVAKAIPDLRTRITSDLSKTRTILLLQKEVINLRKKLVLSSSNFESLKSELTTLREDVGKLDSTDSHRTTATPNDAELPLRRASLSNEHQSDSGSKKSIEEKVASLKYQLTLMESRMGQEFLQFGNICLRSYLDTCLFINDNVKNNSFGCFFDLVALMNSPRDSQTDEKTFLDTSYNAQRTKFLSLSEVSTSTSFLHVTPLVFCASKQQLHDSFVVHGSVDKMLPLVKKREFWSSKGGMFGMKRELERNISSKVSAIDLEIRDTLGSGPAADLAREYLRASHGCFQDFVNWTENFFHELQAMASVSEEEAWALILDCWMTFFVDLRKIRMECSSLSLAGLEPDSDRRKEIVARYIWTMGRAIKLQDEFREKQFRNHTSIATVINFYLFSHKVSQTAHDEQVQKIQDELKSLQGWRSSATRDLNKVTKKT